MAQYISKSALVEEIERRIKALHSTLNERETAVKFELKDFLSFLNTLEVKDPYEQCVQHDSIKAGIQAHAETYSFNIESKLFNQLTKEQQALWRKEIEQACISGGEAGVELARDTRYKENLEVKEVDLELVTGWFDHIAQIADDRMTLTGQRMTDSHALDEIKCIAKNSSEFITKYYKVQKGEKV